MNYNLHPIFVHFPIALLFLYSAMRIFRWPAKIKAVDWTIPRLLILALGLIGAWISSATGDAAAHLTHPDRNILSLHEFMSELSTGVFLSV